jgi:hypothetical protein
VNLLPSLLISRLETGVVLLAMLTTLLTELRAGIVVLNHLLLLCPRISSLETGAVLVAIRTTLLQEIRVGNVI